MNREIFCTCGIKLGVLKEGSVIRKGIIYLCATCYKKILDSQKQPMKSKKSFFKRRA